MPTPAIRQYPPLSAYISADKLPEFLSGLMDSVSGFLNTIFVKNYRLSKSIDGATTTGSLSLVLYDTLSWELADTGFKITLNPSENAISGVTEISFQFIFQNEFLQLTGSSNANSFSFSEDAFFENAEHLTGTSLEELFKRSVEIKTLDGQVASVVADINSFYSLSPVLSVPNNGNVEDDITDLIININALSYFSTVGKDARDVLFEVYYENSGISKEQNLNTFFYGKLRLTPKDTMKRMVVPKIKALVNLGIGLEFPRTVLVPLDGSGEVIADTNVRSTLVFAKGNLLFENFDSFKYIDNPGASLSHVSQIGNTGLTLTLTGVKLDLSASTNIPEATAAGYGPEFKGVFVQLAAIGLPKLFSDDPGNQNPAGIKLEGTNLLIGTGGFSGKVGLVTTGAPLYKKIGDFGIGFNSFDVTFLQNSITGSSIDGFLTIPGFKKNNTNADAVIGIKAAFDTGGNFKITANTSQLLDKIGLKDVFTVSVKSLAVAKLASRFYVEVSGTVDIVASVSFAENILPKGIKVDRLRIWDDGSFEFVGGVVFPTKPVHIKLGPVEIDVTSISFGTEERSGRKYAYFGFDAALKVDPGGVEARGNGIKFYFSIDGGALDTFFRIEGIGIDIILPGSSSASSAALILKGFLSVTDSPSGGESYVGSISAELPQIGIRASVAMAYTPSLPAFAVDMSLSLPAPIPLGPTGLGIYAFRGLIGQRYVANKQKVNLDEEASWFDYYKTPPLGVSLPKFEAEPGFSLGAGVQVGTATDGGKTFNANVFFLLSLPKVFLLEGRGALLKQRAGLDATDEPPFYAMLAISPDSVEAGFGVNLNFPESGEIAKIQGSIELAFFFKNASAWYVNVGRETPDEKRVQAEILTLFQAYFFMMFSNSGIRAGAGASWSFDKKYGPVGVSAGASLDMRGFINFSPTQLGGSIAAAAHLKVKVFGFGFGFELGAGLSAEAPKPFIVAGYFYLKIELPWPFKDISLSLDFVWAFNKSYNLEEVILYNIEDAAKAINILTGETFQLSITDSLPANPEIFNETIIPLDSYIDVEFLKPVKPSSHQSLDKIGGIYGSPKHTELVPPKKGKQQQVKHEFTLEQFEIYSWNPQTSSWDPYDVYRAMLPGEGEPAHPDLTAQEESVLDNLKYGFWQSLRPNHYQRIRVLGQTPFSFMEQMTGENPAEDFGFDTEGIFCEHEVLPPTCVNFDLPGAYGFKAFESGTVKGTVFYIESEDADKVAKPEFGFNEALRLKSGNFLRIDFDETVLETSLKLSTLNDKDVVVRYYAQSPDGVDYNGLQKYQWTEVHSKTLGPVQLSSAVDYNDSNGIDRIIVEAPSCEKEICNVATEGHYLFYVLQKMLADGFLDQGSGTLSQSPYPTYLSVLFPTISVSSISYTTETLDGLNFQGFLSSEATGTCLLNITIVNPPEFNDSYINVTQLINPRPNPAATSRNEMLIDAVIGETLVTLKVESCLELVSCTLIEDRCQLSPNDDYLDMFELMINNLISEGLLFREGQGGSAQLSEGLFPLELCNLLYEDGINCEEELMYLKFTHPTSGDICNVQAGYFVAETFLNSEPVNGCYFAFDLPEGYSLNQVNSISNIQVDPIVPNPSLHTRSDGQDSFVTSEIYHFTCTVMIDGIAITLRGSTCFPIFQCVDQCSTFLHELCFLREQDVVYNANIPSQTAINSQNQAVQEAVTNTIIPIWRPYTTYAILAKTRDKLSGPDSRTYDRQFVLGFNTNGPMGYFHHVHPPYAGLSMNEKEQIKLKDLKFYLDYDKSYPSPSGNVLNAKPLYYTGPEINIFYVMNYLTAMYNRWSEYNGNDPVDAQMSVDIYDPRPAASVKTPLGIENFKKVQTNTTPISIGAQMMSSLSENGDPCEGLGEINPPEFKISVSPTGLQPEKMYSVVITSHIEGQTPDPAEIFRFNFQTSRYGSFQEHISSFDLGGGIKAQYNLEIESLTPDIKGTVQGILDNTLLPDNALHENYANDFEKLVTGVLKLSVDGLPLSNTPPATGLEVNIVRGVNQEINGIWIRSTEPLNDPRLPIQERGNTTSIQVDGGALGNVKTIHSKDMSEIFITTASTTVPQGSYSIDLDYLLYDGQAYMSEASSTLTFTIA